MSVNSNQVGNPQEGESESAESPLPGARRFYEYLVSLLPGKTIAVSAPKVDEVLQHKEYEITVDGKYLGMYTVTDPKPNDPYAIKHFWGDIPGYVSGVTESSLGDDSVPPRASYANLVWSRIEDSSVRHDNCDDIPFP